MTGPVGVPVRVLVVDDDPLVRTGLRLLLAGDPSIAVVGEAADGDEVAGLVTRMPSDVVLMDVRMPRQDGIETARRLAELADGPAVVMLTTFDADATVLAALRAGAAGFLLKHAAPEEIITAVHRAAAGDPVFSPSALRTLMAHARESETDEADDADPTRERWRRLSERERRVAAAVARGLSNTQIAAELYLSTGTVKAEVSAILAALGLANRIQLAIFVSRRDLGGG